MENEALARHVPRISDAVIECSIFDIVNRGHTMATQLSIGVNRCCRISNFNSSQQIADLVTSVSVAPRSPYKWRRRRPRPI